MLGNCFGFKPCGGARMGYQGTHHELVHSVAESVYDDVDLATNHEMSGVSPDDKSYGAV